MGEIAEMDVAMWEVGGWPDSSLRMGRILVVGNVELCPAWSGMCGGKLGIACVLRRAFLSLVLRN